MVGSRKIDRLGSIGGFSRLAALFFSLLTVTCSNTDVRSKPHPSGPVTLTVGLPVQTGEDPIHGGNQAARLLSFEGLTYVARDGRPQPRLAQGWTESEDGLLWSITLRPNAVFHDGSNVDSSSVKESLQESIGGGDQGLTPGLSDIIAIETPSSTELRIRLKARSSFLLEDLSVPIAKFGPDGRQFGTGPFVIVPTSGAEIVMAAVPNYYRGRPAIDRIIWKAFPTVRTAWAAMMRGEIDFLYEVGPDAREFIQSETSIQLFPFLRNYVYAIVLNTRQGALGSSQVRRALNNAIDRALIVDQALKGHGKPASGPAWPEHWAFDSSVPEYSYDPARATALLDSANIPQMTSASGSGTIPGRLHFTCLVPENFALWERMGLIVQRSFSEIGVDMQFESVPFATFNRRIAVDHDFDAAIMELVVGNSSTRPFFFWHSQGRLNAWGFKNPNVDNALDGIRRASNESEYRQAFRQFQIETIDSAPAIFFALGETARAVSKRFRVVAPAGGDILPTVFDWRLAEDATMATN